MSQVDDLYLPKYIEVSNDTVLRLADFSLLDNHILTKVTLDFLCYDEIVVSE